MAHRFRQPALYSLVLASLFFCATSCSDAKEALQIRYYAGGTVPEYAEKVLKLALTQSSEAYTMTPVSTKMTTPRIIETIKNNTPDNVNLFWAASSAELENALAAIPVPIERGLIGFRILVVRQELKKTIRDMDSESALRNLKFLQGIGWSDSVILRQNGFQVLEAAPENLYNMLAAGRADAFPRSVIDAPRELGAQLRIHPDLSVVQNIAMIYPKFGVFFFVSKENKALHQAIENGLRTAIRNGSFQKLYEADPDIKNALKFIRSTTKIFLLANDKTGSVLQKLDPDMFEPSLKTLTDAAGQKAAASASKN